MNEHPPSVEILQGPDELVCLVYNYSPSAVIITWLLNSLSVQHDNITSPAKGPDGKFSVKSRLKVEVSEWPPEATYTCQIKHINRTITRSISKQGNFIFLEPISIALVFILYHIQSS